MSWPWFRQGENRRKRLYFHHTVEMKRPHTITEPIEIQRIRIGFFLMNRLKLWGSSVCCGGASAFGGFPLKGMAEPIAFLQGKQEKVIFSTQHGEKYRLFLQFSVGKLHDCGISLFIYLEFQEIKHQPFPMAQPFRINAGNAAASDVQKENWRLSHASYRLK